MPSVHSSFLYNCQALEATQVSISRLVDKEYLCVYTLPPPTHSRIVFSHENEILASVSTWMELEGIILSIICQAETNTL